MFTASGGPVVRSMFARLGILLCMIVPVMGTWDQPDAFATDGSQLKASSDGLWLEVTGEYTTYFGGEPQAIAQITTTINRVTGIYEREVSNAPRNEGRRCVRA